MPALSVIMPVYNAAPFLERAVNSILNSTFADLELILIDDGSTDGSALICDQFVSNDPRVRVRHKNNGGVSSARNMGLDMAQGDFVAFVDSDDFISPSMYDKLMLSVCGNDLALCDMMIHTHDGEWPQKTLDVSEEKSRTIGELLLSGIGGGPCHMVSRRDLIGSLRFPEYIVSGEDLWFTLRLFVKAERMAKVNEPLYYYNRENAQSITHTLNSKTENSILQGMTENRVFLKEAGLFNDVIQEFYWHILRFKSLYALDPDRCNLYRDHFPEANRYLRSCPLLSPKVKGIMMMLDLHFDFVVRPILHYWQKRAKS